MGFLLDAIIEALKILFIVGVIYAVMGEPFESVILPMLDEVEGSGINDLRETVKFVWYNWGIIAVIGAVIYGWVAAMNRTAAYGQN